MSRMIHFSTNITAMKRIFNPDCFCSCFFFLLFYFGKRVRNIFTDATSVDMITVAFPDISVGVTFPIKAPGFMQYGCLLYYKQDWVDQTDVVNLWLHT